MNSEKERSEADRELDVVANSSDGVVMSEDERSNSVIEVADRRRNAAGVVNKVRCAEKEQGVDCVSREEKK